MSNTTPTPGNRPEEPSEKPELAADEAAEVPPIESGDDAPELADAEGSDAPRVETAEPGGSTDPQFTTAPVTEDEVDEGPVFVEQPVTAEPPEGLDTTTVGAAEPADQVEEPADEGADTDAVGAAEPVVARDAYNAPPDAAPQSWAPEPAVADGGAAAVATAGTAGEHYVAPQPGWVPAADASYGQPVTPIYVTAPVRPTPKSNRGVGILIVLLATLVYAVLLAALTLAFQLIFISGTRIALNNFSRYLATPTYYLPVIVFALAFILLVVIVNRGGWWAYILGAFGVAVLVYLAYVGGSLITLQIWNSSRSAAQWQLYLGPVFTSPIAVISAVVAREVPIWFGAWIAARGRKLRTRNADAQADYERQLAAGPQPVSAP